MLRKDNWFIPGWIYLFALYFLNKVLPKAWGAENSVFENIQLVFLIAGFGWCAKMLGEKLPDWGGNQKALWQAGMIFFFLLFARELSWGRVFFIDAAGRIADYSIYGPHGKTIVHGLVGVLTLGMLYLLYKAKVWNYLKLTKIPDKNFTLLLLFIAVSWVGEKGKYPSFHGDLAEELAEMGAYMMMFYLLRESTEYMKTLKKQ